MADPLRLLFVGDVIGPTGRGAIQALIPGLRRELALDAVVINGENSADNGFGLSESSAEVLLAVADFVTLGDHAFDQPETGALLEREPRIIRPVNFAAAQPGRGYATFEAAGVRVGVVNVLGKLFMRPEVTDPYVAASEAVQALRSEGARVILVDMQAEATSEKQAMAWHLAGSVTALLGTHTHIPTADLRLLPGGTAFVADVGMTGSRDGIIGFDREGVLASMVRREHRGWAAPGGAPARLDGILIVADPESGQAIAAERIYREA
jgi:metallophosphoesterase (TIGR00282 family)